MSNFQINKHTYFYCKPLLLWLMLLTSHQVNAEGFRFSIPRDSNFNTVSSTDISNNNIKPVCYYSEPLISEGGGVNTDYWVCVTRSDDQVIGGTSSGFLNPGNMLDTSNISYTLAFNVPMTFTVFQLGEFNNLSAGENYVFTPNTGTPLTIADNSGSIVGSVATLNPTDWNSITSLTVSYTGSAGSSWRVGLDNMGFTATDSTPPSVTGITVKGSPAANATSMQFTVAFDENANGISTDDFSVTTASGTATGSVSAVSAASGSSVDVTVNSISGAGTIRLDLNSNTNITDDSGNGNNTNGYTSAYTSGSTHTVDLIAPTITAITIPDSVHKVGDTVTATITVSSDSDDYTGGSGGISGTIDGYTLGSLSKTNDTTYTATFTITDGGTDVAAASDVAVNVTLTDSSGNAGSAFTTAISQASDAIYANLPDISLSADTNTIAEDGGVSTLTATLANSLNNQWPDAITVNLSYSGTATVTTDYIKSNSITISAGNSTGTSTVTSVADSHHDAAIAETVIVDIDSVSVGNEDGVQQETISIIDAELAPTVTLSVGNSTVAESGGTSSITATLSTATYANVTVNLAYSGTATSGSDYGTPSSSITITGGSTSANATVGITATDDSDSEGDETLIIDISSVTGGSAGESGTQQQTITITDDDDTTAPVLAVVTAVTSPTNDTTPDFTFSTTEEGTLTVSGSCGTSSSTSIATTGNHTITLTASDNSSALSDATYSDCSIQVTDAANNASTSLSVPSFTVDTAAITGHSVSFDDSQINNSESSSQSFTFAGGEVGASFTYTISSTGGGTNVTGSGTLSSATDQVSSLNLSGLGDGTLTVSVVVTDTAGNVSSAVTDTTTLDTTSASGHSVSFDDSQINNSEASSQSFTFAGGEVGASFTYTISSTGGGTNVTGSGTLSSATDQVSSLNLSGLGDGTLTVSVVVTDTAGNVSSAVTDTATLDTSTPTLSSSSPADGSTGARYDTDLELTFDESIAAGSSGDLSIAIYDADDDSLIESNDSDSAQVTVSGSVVTMSLSSTLASSHSYYVQIGADAIEDAVGNKFSGISDKTTLNFTTTNITPVVTNDSTSTNEDNAIAISVLDNDSDEDGTLNAASVTVVTGPTNGSTSVNTGTGVITYTPTADFNGADSFTYTVEDNHSQVSSSATVSITVTAQNDAPVAVADLVSTAEDTAITIDVAANDTDIDTGDAVDTGTIVLVSLPSDGTATVSAGKVDYTPDANFNGTDTFTYTIDDGNSSTSNTATVTVNVTSVNDLPVAVDDTATVDEDSSIVIDVLNSDSDVDGTLDVTTVTIQTTPSSGEAVVNTINGEITYTPAADFNGSDTFTYTVKDDSDGTSNEATVTVTVTSINDAPVVVNDTVTLLEDTSHTINALGNDSDVDGTLDAATVEIVTAPESGTTSVNSTSGAIIYTPNDDFNGSDSLTYRVQDNEQAWSNTATVSLTVTAVNDAPLANNDTAVTLEDESVVIDLLSNDSDVDGTLDATTLAIQSSPGQGSLTDNGDGTVTFTPNQEYSGSDSFTYQVKDDEGVDSNLATVSITVTEVNDAPVISGTPSTSVLEGANYSFVPSISDVEGDTLTVSASNLPVWLSLNASTGALSGTPELADVGDYQNILLSVSDGNSTADLSVFSIEVVGDFDRDSIADSDDVDDDNDGMDDAFELAHNLNPLDASDAALDSDSDGLTNLEEAQQGSNPQVDDQAPEFGVLAALDINATGLLTTLPEFTVPVAVDALDGDVSVELGTSLSNSVAPGRYLLTWLASDAAGNQAETTQVLNVHPQISLSKDQTVGEGVETRFRVLLNGESPTYPMTVPFDVSGTADNTDHDLVDGSVTFEDGETSKTVTVNVVDDGVLESSETILVALTGSGNLGTKQQHTITIVEENVAPQLVVTLNQNGNDVLIVNQADGVVNLTATVTDPNPNDEHTIEWTLSGGIVTTALSDQEIEFDPAQVDPGLYQANVRVSDNGAPVLSNETRLSFVVIPQAPTLSPTQDSDGDGISDEDEGLGDSDQDGQPNYLDAIPLPNVLNEQVEDGYQYLIEGDPGVQMSLGQRAIVSQNGGAKLDNNNLPSELRLPEDSVSNSGGYFDFVANDIPEIGQSVSVVIPQRVMIPENAVYRKFDNVGGWYTFVEDANNSVMSAPGDQGVCPPPQSNEYQAGLNVGDWCVQLTIEDGGPNDADGMANGSIEDPGGVGVLQNASISSTGSGGGSFNWSFIVMLMGWLMYSLRRKDYRGRAVSIQVVSVCLILFSFNSQADEPSGWVAQFKERGYFEMGLMGATSSQSRQEFSDALASSGVTADIQKYDTDRLAYNFTLGYRYLDWSAVEVGFLDLGDVEVRFDGLSATQEDLKNALDDHYPITGQGWTLGNRFQHEILSRWSVSGELGLFFWEGDIDVSGADINSKYDDEEDPYIGLASHYQIMEGIALGAKWRRMFMDGQRIDLLGASLVVGF